MSRIYLLTGYAQIRNTFFNANTRAVQSIRFNSNTNNSDDEAKHERTLEEKERSKEALEKLNKLLLSMTGEDVSSTPKLNLAQPVSRRRKNLKDDQSAEPSKAVSTEVQIKNAVKNVAESIGGDVKQTQSELLMKLLSATHDDGTSASNISDLVKGMKVDHEHPVTSEQTKAQQVRQLLQERPSDAADMERFRPRKVRPTKTPLSREKIDLFSGEPLGIFTENQTDTTEGVENKIWNQLYEKDLKLAVTHPPSSYFQQMILWTEQRKIWKFPIDNEQDMDEDKKVYFTEHVFLEKHLEPWCPRKGPLRHFMELVCVGLSKNPYLTVEAKREHILWFKKYFEEKKQLLRETGAIQDLELDNPESSQKQIE